MKVLKVSIYSIDSINRNNKQNSPRYYTRVPKTEFNNDMTFTGKTISTKKANEFVERFINPFLGIIEDFFMKQTNRNPNIIPKDLENVLTEVIIKTQDDINLKCWETKNPDLNKPWVVYFHGNGERLDDEFTTETIRALINKLGKNVLAMTYRGFADNPGKFVTQTSLCQDAMSGIKYLNKKYEVPIGNMFPIGHSLGCGIVFDLLKQDEFHGEFLKAIVISAFSTTKELTQYILSNMLRFVRRLIEAADPFIFKVKNEFNNREAVKHPNVKKTKVLMFHSVDDKDQPIKGARDLLEEAKKNHNENLELIEILTGGHYSLGPEEIAAISKFLNKVEAGSQPKA